MSLIEIAKKFATEKHEGQFRFDGVTPYIRHPEDVARRVASGRGEGMLLDAMIATAWLHDVVEDQGVTQDDLLEIGVTPTVVRAVLVLTKKPGQDYMEYLEGVRANYMARKVKIADMLANLSDSPSRKQVKKYTEGLAFLLNGII